MSYLSDANVLRATAIWQQNHARPDWASARAALHVRRIRLRTDVSASVQQTYDVAELHHEPCARMIRVLRLHGRPDRVTNTLACKTKQE